MKALYDTKPYRVIIEKHLIFFRSCSVATDNIIVEAGLSLPAAEFLADMLNKAYFRGCMHVKHEQNEKHQDAIDIISLIWLSSVKLDSEIPIEMRVIIDQHMRPISEAISKFRSKHGIKV